MFFLKKNGSLARYMYMLMYLIVDPVRPAVGAAARADLHGLLCYHRVSMFNINLNKTQIAGYERCIAQHRACSAYLPSRETRGGNGLGMIGEERQQPHCC
eukprot:SAG31_NODE_4130_length_3555_cov_7.058449_2_plen_100_part_00